MTAPEPPPNGSSHSATATRTTCAKGSELWSQFVAKAQFGAKLAYDMMREHEHGRETRLRPIRRTGRTSQHRSNATAGTLTPLDKKPAWRGKKPNKGSI